MKTIIQIVFLPAILAAGLVAAASTTHSEVAPGVWTVSEDLTVSEIHPGVWVHTSWRELASGARFPANGLLVRHGDELTLVDTAWGAELTEALLGWIEAELKLPVTRAVVTHFHDDSMGGMPVLAERGIPALSHALTRTLAQSEGVTLPDSLGDLEIGDAVALVNLEVFYPGPGHSEDNLVVWVPDAGVLFGTCAVRTPYFPGVGNTADADVASWPRAIRRVLERYPAARIVVPGHGPPGDVDLLSHTIDLFNY